MQLPKNYLKEITRPWKVFSLILGIAVLIYGSFYYRFSDWDIVVSILMASLTYLTAPWTVKVILKRKFRQWPLAFFYLYISVDGCYWAYHMLHNNEMIRDWNFYTSAPLYLIMGCFWLYEGSLKDFFEELIKK